MWSIVKVSIVADAGTAVASNIIPAASQASGRSRVRVKIILVSLLTYRGSRRDAGTDYCVTAGRTTNSSTMPILFPDLLWMASMRLRRVAGMYAYGEC